MVSPVTATCARLFAVKAVEPSIATRVKQRIRAAFDPARLEQKPAGGATAYVLMHGAIQHDLYHAGQIAVLKKGTK